MKPIYFLNCLNEKALNVLVQDMTFKTYRFSDTVLEHEDIINNLYIVKEGELRLQRLKIVRGDEDAIIKKKLGHGEIVEHRVLQLISKKVNHITDYKDMAIRTRGQPFGEEYIFSKDKRSPYRAIVNSASAIIVTISFELILNTLSTFEMFQDEMKSAIETKHNDYKLWQLNIDKKSYKILKLPEQITPNTLSEEFFKKTLKLKIDPGPRKIHVPKLLKSGTLI